MIWTVCWGFLRRGAQDALSYRGAFLIRLAGMAMTVASLVFFSRFVDTGGSPLLARYGGNYLSFGLVGIVLMNLQHSVLSAYPLTIRAAQLAGTLEAMLATPTPSWMVLLCAPVYKISTAVAGATLALMAGGLLLGMTLTPDSLLVNLAVLLLSPIAFAAMGFFAATLTMLLRRSDPVSLFVGGVSALAGGVFYPTRVLPGWLSALGKVLPITHALELIRRSAFGDGTIEALLPSLVALLVLSALAAPLGLGSFVWAVRRARRDGSLSHY